MELYVCFSFSFLCYSDVFVVYISLSFSFLFLLRVGKMVQFSYCSVSITYPKFFYSSVFHSFATKL